jgi:hypothetical protein
MRRLITSPSSGAKGCLMTPNRVNGRRVRQKDHRRYCQWGTKSRFAELTAVSSDLVKRQDVAPPKLDGLPDRLSERAKKQRPRVRQLRQQRAQLIL